jgi:hypothetical protein
MTEAHLRGPQGMAQRMVLFEPTKEEQKESKTTKLNLPEQSPDVPYDWLAANCPLLLYR